MIADRATAADSATASQAVPDIAEQVTDDGQGIVELVPEEQHAFHGTHARGSGRVRAVPPSQTRVLALPTGRSVAACAGLPRCVGSGASLMLRIVVLNPKGGSGKSTLAVNIASWYAVRDLHPVLMDRDPQGSATRWFRKRGPGMHRIDGIAAFEDDQRTTRSFRLRIPDGATRVIVDTPAAIPRHMLADYTRDADKIIVPVLPSDIDVHACTRIISDLLLTAKVRREEDRIGVVANRVRRNTLVYQSLQRFLATLNVPVVATLRDSQNYIRSAELGAGIHEMRRYLVADDVAQWQPLMDWIEAGARRRQQLCGAGPEARGTAAPELVLPGS